MLMSSYPNETAVHGRHSSGNCGCAHAQDSGQTTEMLCVIYCMDKYMYLDISIHLRAHKLRICLYLQPPPSPNPHMVDSASEQD